MENTFGSKMKRAWNALRDRDPTLIIIEGYGSTYRPDRPRLTRGNERSIVTSVFNRIALDVADLDFRHCYLDDDNRYKETIDSTLNNCLNLEANLDQTASAFIQDVVISMLDEGCVAIVPIDTLGDPNKTESYEILTLRTAKILEWKPYHVRIRVYNDRTGLTVEKWVDKKTVAIIENPLYAIINEPNSTMQRLIRKLSLLDVTDEKTASGKLDLIVQFPYSIKSDTRRAQAQERIQSIEMQLSKSKYGIAYADGTERITQLNRSLENNLMKQVEYLTNMVFSQLGMTQSILDGTADEQTMLNYHNRTVGPIVSVFVQEMRRKFLSKTARTRKQSIEVFRDPFKLVPINVMAEVADKFTRNEIMSSNEIRQGIGAKPSSDPKADELRNSNISHPKEEDANIFNKHDEEGENQNGI